MADKTATTAEPEASIQNKAMSCVRTEKGLVLLAEIILSLIVLICYADSWFGRWLWVPIVALVFSVFFVIFMLDIKDLDRQSRWIWQDFSRAVVHSIAYFISSIIMLVRYDGVVDSVGLAGALFGLVNGLIYAYDTYIIVLQINSSRQQNGCSEHRAAA